MDPPRCRPRTRTNKQDRLNTRHSGPYYERAIPSDQLTRNAGDAAHGRRSARAIIAPPTGPWRSTSRVATLLPCNVVVRSEDGRTVVEALDPKIVAEVPDNPALAPIAEEAGQRIGAALDALGSV